MIGDASSCLLARSPCRGSTCPQSVSRTRNRPASQGGMSSETVMASLLWALAMSRLTYLVKFTAKRIMTRGLLQEGVQCSVHGAPLETPRSWRASLDFPVCLYPSSFVTLKVGRGWIRSRGTN